MKTLKTVSHKKARHKKAKMAKAKIESPKRGRMAELKEILLAKRQALFGEIRKDLGEHRGTTLRGSVVLDPAEEAGIALEDAINFAAVDRRTELLKQADHALERLKEGTYGICEDCGEEISIGRLTKPCPLLSAVRGAKRNERLLPGSRERLSSSRRRFLSKRKTKGSPEGRQG